MRGVLATIGALIMLAVGCSATQSPSMVEQQKRQLPTDSVVISDYDFVNVAADTVIDPTGSMNRFFERLSEATELQDSQQVKINILHYGDSHVQGAMFPDVVMRRLQRTFGNAGRGFLTPHKITKSNEAFDYKITTPNNWSTSRLIELKADNAIGVGGVGIKSVDPQQRFIIQTLPKGEPYLDYSFNRVVVFHDSLAPMVSVREELLSDISMSDKYYDFTTEIDLTKTTDSVMLYTFKQGKFSSGEFYGFSVENGKNGVLYHTMGINGACYVHWGRKPEVARQSKAFSPDLIIISMGSNEAAGYNFIESVFYAQVDSFVKRLRAENPTAAILLTTPAEAMRVRKRTTSPNPNFEKIQKVILEYGKDKGIAVFDLYAATGGVGSSKKWVSNKMMQRDRIHYTQEGYNLQGLLLYGALLNRYKQIFEIK